MNTPTQPQSGKYSRRSSKVWVRVSPETGKQLHHVADKFGFKSRYQVVQHIAASFIRVADIENAEKNESLPPKEAESIFGKVDRCEKDFGTVKPVRPSGITRKESKANPRHATKVMANLTPKQHIRLDRIVKKYGFASNYEALQYAIACFIRAFDTTPKQTAWDTEIEDTFEAYEHAEAHFQYVKPKRNMSNASLNDM